MRGWQLQNGDLVLGKGGYAEITGTPKIQQDLMVAILTPYGSDRFHPTWGSTLENKIGSPQGASTEQLVTSEVTRVVQNYMLVQANTLSLAQQNGYVSPYTNDDMVSGIASMTSQSLYTTVQVNCVLSTAAATTTTLSTAVSPSGVTASLT